MIVIYCLKEKKKWNTDICLLIINRIIKKKHFFDKVTLTSFLSHAFTLFIYFV